MKALAAVGVLLLAVGCAGCTRPVTSHPTGSELTAAELVRATAAARQEIEATQAIVTAASVVARPGRVRHPNTAFRCGSGRVLSVQLIGTFPHTVTPGRPVYSTEDRTKADVTVRAVVLTLDAASGHTCQISVQTTVHRQRHGTPLQVS